MYLQQREDAIQKLTAGSGKKLLAYIHSVYCIMHILTIPLLMSEG